MILRLSLVCLLLAAAVLAQDDFLYGTFPDGFEFGSATASYQIEGGWDANGKGENIWDHMVHTNPGSISDGSNGDVAADSYHLYKTDVAILKEMGVDFYRFSLSWSRLLPTGYVSEVNQDGVDYYNNLINELVANGIKPLVTLYHWDLPQPLQERLGGWQSEALPAIFGEYADFAYTMFGDRVKSWITLNEPWVVSHLGYGTGSFAPQVSGNGRSNYVAAHNLIKAHATAWHVYDDKFRNEQGGTVGITIDSGWLEPKTQNAADIEAAERGMQFKLGWFAHPIFSEEGDYPAVMKEYVAKHSQEEGLPQSRLPEFGSEWVQYIKGSSDFFGLNHYTTSLAEYGVPGETPSWDRDQEIYQGADPSWPGSAAEWLKVVPWGFRKLLNYIKDEYNNPRLIVTENGFADRGELNDSGRVNYYRSYINEMMKAVNIDGCNVFGYTAWSILDNFEWTSGYSVRFGLYNVDMDDPARPRTAKDSSRALAQIIRDHGFPAPLESNSV